MSSTTTSHFEGGLTNDLRKYEREFSESPIDASSPLSLLYIPRGVWQKLNQKSQEAATSRRVIPSTTTTHFKGCSGNDLA